MAIGVPAISVSFASSPIDVSVSESWTAASVTATVTTSDEPIDDIGDACTISFGLDSATLQLTGYIDSVEMDANTHLWSVQCRDVMMRAVDYFLIPLESGDAEYMTQGLDAGAEIAGLLGVAGLTAADVATLGFAIVAGYGFQLMSVWDAISGIALLGNWRVYAGADGAVHVTDNQVEYPGVSAATLTDTEDITRLSVQWSLDEIINRIVVAGTDVYVIETALGRLGWWKTAVISRPWITTEALAQDIADLNLALYATIKPVVRARVVGHQDLHVGDGITIVENSLTPLGIAGNWVIYEMTKRAGSEGMVSDMVLRQ